MDYQYPQYAALVKRLLDDGKTTEQIAAETGYPVHSVELCLQALERRGK